MLLSRHSGTVDIDQHHLLYICEEGRYPQPPFLAEVDRLAMTTPGAALILTGIDTGPVRVTVEQHDATPDEPTETWEETGEVDFPAVDGEARFGSFQSIDMNHPPLTPPGPGRYRLRVYCRGRDIAFDEIVDEPVEEYLIMIWPTRTA